MPDGAAPPRDDEERDDDDARRDRSTLVVGHLAGAARQCGGGDVVAGEPRDPTADERAEDDGVPDAAQPEREAEHRRRDAERHHVRQRVEVGAERRRSV